MRDAFIVDGIRTAVGNIGGGLSDVRPDDLAAHVISEVMRRNPSVDPAAIEQVPQATGPFGKVGHSAVPGQEVHGVSSTALIAEFTRRYSARSTSSCFRPAGVRRYVRTVRPLSDTAAAALTQPLSSSFCSAG